MTCCMDSLCEVNQSAMNAQQSSGPRGLPAWMTRPTFTLRGKYSVTGMSVVAARARAQLSPSPDRLERFLMFVT
jgi:hypothetical protein